MISDRDIADLQLIIRRAGHEIMKVYSESDIGIRLKNDKTPITIADEASNFVLQQGIKNLLVSYPIISEEDDSFEYHKRKNFEKFWLIDPLDGTKEFISKNGEFAICVALIYQCKSVFGLVYAPALEKMYMGIQNEGAYDISNGIESKLSATNITMNQSHLRFGVSRSHANQAVSDYISTFENPEIIEKGSVLKLTEIAAGNIDIYPRFDENTSEWDIAAGQIILEEAGGQVLDFETKKPLLYNKVSIKNKHFLATANVL